ncbi:MFS transporter [Pontibacillus salipaludis]|uniref:MFS transporter n=1 Tax=Pontibacillus salipaludis TaxID=1697394 RepID=A0ABQ1QBA4_9BACI|nr:MFS transporter [Pontibacillus salipaludis]GGD21762.1 MFS transporter [Pontibacillus salipaludis]
MSRMKKDKRWSASVFLLAALGISTIGDWVFLIALNLMVLNKTGSPFAVTILYLLRPAAMVVTNIWAGSFVDRIDQRNTMLWLDLFRGMLVLFISITTNLSLIYGLVFLIYMGSSISETTTLSYMTKLVPVEKRKRFNAWRSLLDSGGFVLGPAIAGLLFIISSLNVAIALNGLSFIISALIVLKLPKMSVCKPEIEEFENMSLDLLLKDFKAVWHFTKTSRKIIVTYSLVALLMIGATAIDSLEAAFSKNVLSLSDKEYGFLVSIAGAGYVCGALAMIVLAKRLENRLVVWGGSILVSCGYITYGFSTIFIQAAAGFFLLSFFMAWVQTGFNTYVQQSVPALMIGRISSIYGWIEALLTLLATIVIGMTAEIVSIQSSVAVATLCVLGVIVILLCVSLYPKGSSIKQSDTNIE